MQKKELMSAREERRLELEREFTYDGYYVVRKELYANQRDPAITVRDGSIAFNTACIQALDDAVYVRLYFNEELGRFAVRKVDEHDKNALRWCTVKENKRKTRRVNCPDLTDLIYTTMKWDKTCRYRILGYLIKVDEEEIFVFDFTVTRVYNVRPKKGEPGHDQPVDRKGFYQDEVVSTFGVPAEEYERQTEVFEENGYINVAMLTGPRPRKSNDQQPEDEPESSGTVEENDDEEYLNERLLG